MAHANVTCPGTNSSFYLQSAPHPPLSSWRLSICRCSGKNSRASLTSLPTHLRQIHQPILLVVHLLSISKLYHSCHLGCFHPNSGPNNPYLRPPRASHLLSCLYPFLPQPAPHAEATAILPQGKSDHISPPFETPYWLFLSLR